MAESTDKRTKQIAEKRVEKGQEFERYQEAQNQLLAIQAEQQQNLAIQRNQAQNIMEQNQTLAQAAEIMALDDLNPQTQQVLSGYGLNQPRVIKNSDVKRQGPTNITINNTTINNTSGPVQGREVNIRPQEASQGRFKAWLTNVFARQDALFQKQNQEYVRRESSLTRNANKMLRKLDGIGKDIGKALDPRRIADTERNRIKTLATIIGIPLLIKYLPKLFDSLNNIGVKIKNIFTGENGILAKIKKGMTSKDGWLSTGLRKIYSPDGNGILNELLTELHRKLFDRSEYATKGIKDIPWTEPGKKLVTWLQLFFGGAEAAATIERKKVEKEFKEDLESKKNMSTLNESLRATSDSMASRSGKSLNLQESSRFGISSSDGSTLKAGEYKKWLKDNNLKASDESAKKFLNSKKFAYTGESIILTKRIYDNADMKVFNPKTDLNMSGSLKNNSNYPDLAASLEVIHEIRRGYGAGNSFKNTMGRASQGALSAGGTLSIVAGGGMALRGNLIGAASSIYRGVKLNSAASGKSFSASSGANINEIQNYLSLLMNKSRTYKVLVFPEFITLLASTELEKELKIQKVKVKLIRARFQETTEYIYWEKGTQGLSDYVKKIVRSNATFGSGVDTTPLKLPEKDYLGRVDSTEWEMMELDNVQLGRILEELTGSSKIIYTEEAQTRMQEKLSGNINLRSGELRNYGYSYSGTPEFKTHRYDDYENRMYEVEQYRAEREARSLSSSTSDNNTYTNQDVPGVNYVADSSSFRRTRTQAELETAPRIVNKQPTNVTTAFGGNGTLTSNFMEWRDKSNRYHYGIDLHNGAGDDVKFPGNGTVKRVDGDSIEIVDGNNYVTKYYHIKNSKGLKRGDKVTKNQVIGKTKSKAENGGKYLPHIHVEVHDPEWTRENQHNHYVNPLVYWGDNHSNTPTPTSSANYLGSSGEKGDAPEVTPRVTRRGSAYTPSSTLLTQRSSGDIERNTTNEDRQILLNALGIIADNTAETAHILRNTDRNVASIGGTVSKPAPKPNPTIPSVQTKNP